MKTGSLTLLFLCFAFGLTQLQVGQEAKPKTGAKKTSGNGGEKDKSKPSAAPESGDEANEPADADSFEIESGSRKQTDAYWKKKTPGMAYKVMRQHGTETKFSGKYTRSKSKGIYRCAGCGAILFSSDQKFESGTGWPSFWAPLAPNNVAQAPDNSLPGEPRTEIRCTACEGHLGHVFSDGPAPTGLRYCLNSVALKLDDSEHAKKLMKDAAKTGGKASSEKN